MAALDQDTIFRLIKEQGLITNFIDLPTQLSPNGFELTLQKIFQYTEPGEIDFSNKQRKIPNYEELHPNGDLFSLERGSYLVVYNETIQLPNNLIAIGRPRSSLLRSGVTIESAVWDAGYEGRSRGLLTVSNHHGFNVHNNARLLHLVFLRLEKETKPYEGTYQGEV
jgi:dUTP pyrophosphatase